MDGMGTGDGLYGGPRGVAFSYERGTPVWAQVMGEKQRKLQQASETNQRLQVYLALSMYVRERYSLPQRGGIPQLPKHGGLLLTICQESWSTIEI